VRNKLFAVIILGVFVLATLTIYWWYNEDQGVRALGTGEEYVLLLGLDETGEIGLTDTIFVAKLEADGVKLLSIPRDLRVKFPDGTFHKINAAYSRGGPELARRIVSELLGIEIPWHVVVDYQGFVAFIDAVGGITLTIEKPMLYEDTKQDLVIDLPAGTRTLSGQEALDYWRYRDAATREDLGRIRRHELFLKALAEKLAEIDGASQVKALVETTYQYVRTNLALMDVYKLVDRLQRLGPEDLQFATIPGRAETIEEVSFFLADPVETAALVEEFFLGREVLTNRDVRVIVLNGHPDEEVRPGLARKVSDRLSDQGFQIVALWNANAFDYPQTVLVDLSGDEAKTRRLTSTIKSPLLVVSPEEFSAWTVEQFGEDRLPVLSELLQTTAVPPEDRGVGLNEADLLLILGGDYALTTP
jgi:LCP family protein required for cell wall assembly